MTIRCLKKEQAELAPPPMPLKSRTALLEELSTPKGGHTTVFGKPLTSSEQRALLSTIATLSSSRSPRGGGLDALRLHCLQCLQQAAVNKASDLKIVEGYMIILEQLYLMQAATAGTEAQMAGELQGSMTDEEMHCRWQLLIGGDVGGIQYIPVVEELQVAASGSCFDLDADLDALFARFSGDSSWLSSGHLRYQVRRVRVEWRVPKGWMRGLAWIKWRVAQKSHLPPPGEPDWGLIDDDAVSCRPDEDKVALSLPLPFPSNELFVFCSTGSIGSMSRMGTNSMGSVGSNGSAGSTGSMGSNLPTSGVAVAVCRSKLGGLILLLNKSLGPAAQPQAE